MAQVPMRRRGPVYLDSTFSVSLTVVVCFCLILVPGAPNRTKCSTVDPFRAVGRGQVLNSYGTGAEASGDDGWVISHSRAGAKACREVV